MKHLIVVIENDEDTLELLDYILVGEGYDVKKFFGFSTIEELTALCPSLMMLDERLAGPAGHLICRLLKQDYRTRTIPVILISAVNDLENIARSCGADAHIKKPFDLDELIAKVQLVISHGTVTG